MHCLTRYVLIYRLLYTMDSQHHFPHATLWLRRVQLQTCRPGSLRSAQQWIERHEVWNTTSVRDPVSSHFLTHFE